MRTKIQNAINAIEDLIDKGVDPDDYTTEEQAAVQVWMSMGDDYLVELYTQNLQENVDLSALRREAVEVDEDTKSMLDLDLEWQSASIAYWTRVFHVMPSRKVYVPWSVSVSDAERRKDRAFNEALEQWSSANDIDLMFGAFGDGADIHIMWVEEIDDWDDEDER